MQKRLYLTLCACLCTLEICHSQSPFIEIPVDTLVYTGCSAQLNCSVSDLNATISWSVRVDGRYQQISLGDEIYDPRYNITGDAVRGEFHLYMEVVNKSMESSYKCRVNQTNLNTTANLFVLDRGLSCGVQPGTDVIENVDTAIFNCSIDLPDDAPGEVVWMRNDQEVGRTGNKTSIYMKTFNRSESGDVFTCFYEAPNASFCHGLQSLHCGKNFTMNVQYPPGVSILGSNNSVIEGDVYNRSCSVDANPNATVQWIHRGWDVGNSEILHLQNVQRDQNGTYTCQANNTFWDGSSGNGSATFDLDVQYYPELETEISGSASDAGQVIAGKDITVVCKVTDSNPDVDTIHWNEASSNELLEFVPVSRDDHGWYMCDASNTFWNGKTGFANVNVSIDVQYPPQVSLEVSDDAVVENDPYSRECNVDSNPAASVQWEYEDEVITESNTLFLSNVHRDQHGTYTCRATNTFWDNDSGSDSVSFELDVQYHPDVDIGEHRYLVVTTVEGRTYTEDCTVDANPTATVEWKHGSSVVSDTSLLYLTDVSRVQSGRYECVGTNWLFDGSQGSDSQYFTLNVQYPPTVSTEKRAEIVVGRSLTLSCSVASGNPANANIHWILLNGDRQPGSTLPLTDVTRDMAGNYTCEATNTFHDNTQGVGRSTTYLDVHFEPTVQRSHFSDEVEADIGVNATLVCVMSASPSPTFVWQKDGQQITTSSEETIEWTETTSKLIVAFVTKEDYGDYVSTATNYVSEDRCRIKLVGRRGVSAGGITGIVFGLLIVIGVALALGYYWYRRRKYSPEQTEEQGTSLGSELKHIGKDNEEDKDHYQDLEFTESEKESNYTSLESQYTSLRQPATDTADIYMKLGARSNDFPRQHIKVHELIGTGSYGQINRATATEIAGKSGKTVVAVKSVKDSASDDDKRRLTVELNILQRIEPHRNIVHLLGCCTDKKPVYVIMEFMGLGNLLKYLRDYRRDKTSDYANAARLKLVLKSKDLVSMGKQIAAGMQYLASKSFVHGELAAKTVLLSKDWRTCKLSNIGLRGDVEIEAIRVKEHHTRQPIRWFSPETVSSGEYSTMSDVWSFGVVLWEITTLGKTPYPTAKNVTKVREFISKGFRMKRPAYCDAKLYSVMTRCWSENKTERPSFSKLVIELEGMAKSSEVFIDVKKACADTPDYKKAANEKCYETK